MGYLKQCRREKKKKNMKNKNKIKIECYMRYEMVWS